MPPGSSPHRDPRARSLSPLPLLLPVSVWKFTLHTFYRTPCPHRYNTMSHIQSTGNHTYAYFTKAELFWDPSPVHSHLMDWPAKQRTASDDDLYANCSATWPIQPTCWLIRHLWPASLLLGGISYGLVTNTPKQGHTVSRNRLFGSCSKF